MPLVYVWTAYKGLLLPLVLALEVALANIKPGSFVLLRAEPHE